MVENVISGVKRCRIVKDELRLTKENISDVVMEIACGLHNLRVTFRQPMQTIDITNLEEEDWMCEKLEDFSDYNEIRKGNPHIWME